MKKEKAMETPVQFCNDPIEPAPGLTGNVYGAYEGGMLKWSCYVQGDGVKAWAGGRQEAKNAQLAESECRRILEEAVAKCARRVVAALAMG